MIPIPMLTLATVPTESITISDVVACRNSFGDVYVDIANDTLGGEIFYKIMDWNDSEVVDEGSTVNGWFVCDVSKQLDLFGDSYRYYRDTGTRKPLYVQVSGDRGATWTSWTAYPEDKVDDSRLWCVTPVQGNKFMSQLMTVAKGNDSPLAIRDSIVSHLGWEDKDKLQVIFKDITLTTELIKVTGNNYVIDCSMFDSMNAAQFSDRAVSAGSISATLNTSYYGTAQGGGDHYRSCLILQTTTGETLQQGIKGLAGKFGGLTGYNTVEVEISERALEALNTLQLDLRASDGTSLATIYPESINGAVYNKVAAWQRKGSSTTDDIFRVSFCIHDAPSSVNLANIDQVFVTLPGTTSTFIVVTRFTLLRRDPEFFLSEPAGSVVVPDIGIATQQVTIQGKIIEVTNHVDETTLTKNSEGDLVGTVTGSDPFFKINSKFGAVKGIEFDIWLPEGFVLGSGDGGRYNVHLFWATATQDFAEANVTYTDQTYLGDGWWHFKADTLTNTSSSLDMTGLRIDLPGALYTFTDKSFKIGKVKLIMYTTCFGEAYHSMIDYCKELKDQGIFVMDPVLWYASNRAGYLPVRGSDDYETYAKQYANALEYYAEEISVAGAEDEDFIEDMKVNIIPLPRYYRYASEEISQSAIIEYGGLTTDGGSTISYEEGYGRVVVNSELEDLAIGSDVIQIPAWPPQHLTGYDVASYATGSTSLTSAAINTMREDLVATISGEVGGLDNQRPLVDGMPSPDELNIYKDSAGNVVVEEEWISDSTSKWNILNTSVVSSITYTDSVVTSWPWTWYRDDQLSVLGAEATRINFYVSSISDEDGGAPSYSLQFLQSLT